MMRRGLAMAGVVGLLAGATAAVPLQAQTHVVKKTETVVRAVGVYEWTGDEAKPTASRLVPVSVFINSQLEDAGLYLARPVPFALDTGTVFEVQKAGVAEGTIEVASERHLQGAAAGTAAAPFDQGWTGYGTFKPKPAEKVIAAKKSGPLPQIVASGGKGPHFSSKPDEAAATPVTTDDAGGAKDSKDAKDSRDDGHRPSMRQRTDTVDAGNGKPVNPDDDVDRPTLKKRTPAENKAAGRKGDQASVKNVGELNDDADRPTLHRGVAGVDPGVPALMGIPAGMHQMVAVSDAADRPEHGFVRTWDSDAEKAEVLAKMEEVARARLAQYDVPAAVVAAAVTPAVKASPRGKKQPATAVPAPVALTDESIESYTLSYGGAATFVYAGSSPGVGGATRYVFAVAQRDPAGELKVALTSVTDSTHLDRTPMMRLVDVVDADASNRASLVLELRATHTRQFALYRVIGAKAEQVFQTDTTE